VLQQCTPLPPCPSSSRQGCTHMCVRRYNARTQLTMHDLTTTHSCEQAMYCTHLSGVVGKCCSNMLRSLRAYGVAHKAVRTCVCEKSDTAHVHSSRCAIPYTQPSARSYTSMHTCMPTYQIRTCAYLARPSFQCTNAIVYIMHKRVPLLRTHGSRLCTVLT
jgi:hypothetical protein